MPTPAPEIFRTGYQSLFEVQLLHRYFLNVGTTEFDEEPLSPAVLAAWRAYDVRQVWRIEPSPATRAVLRNQQLLFRLTPEGLRVARAVGAYNAAPLPPDLELTFLVQLLDPAWPLYTSIDLAELQPTATQPTGRVLLLTNTGAPLLADKTEPLTLTSEPWPPTEAGRRPLAVLRIRPGKGGPVFKYVFGNRYTTWEYQGPRADYRGKGLGDHPLVRHGRIALDDFDFPVPNPTPATTIVRDDRYISLIY